MHILTNRNNCEEKYGVPPHKWTVERGCKGGYQQGVVAE